MAVQISRIFTKEMKKARMIELPKMVDIRGNLSVIEENHEIPFSIKRVYWIYDVPGGESRGGHAHRKLYQLIVAVSGSFSVTLDNGKEKQTYFLNRPYQGLLVTPGIWRTLDEFSSGAVCMVLASEYYEASDYIRDYQEFLEYKQQQKNTEVI